ncbi:MAG TPA: ferredoxin [Baekduia sp.]|jgi:ferredoxin|nr:ferredoxin [Baekduia sp.]
MKVKVDFDQCDAHGMCVDACPEVFALDDDDDVVRLLVEEPGESLREDLDMAVGACPKAAIHLEG